MIEVRAVTKRYHDVTAVDRLSFIVRPGQVTGFLGPNGSGKTTTMRMILALDAPDSGEITVAGRHYRGLVRPLRQVGALLDAGAVHPGRSATTHLAVLARSNGIARARVRTVLEEVGLDAVAHQRVGGFSLGMKQRLGIAAALLGDPPVLLFDEPVNGLDPEGVRWVRRLFRSLAAQGRTILVSSHLLSEMALTADHLVVIGQGRLIADTSVSDFLDADTATQVLVRTPVAPELSRLLNAHGADVEPAADGALVVTGATAAQVGDLAAAHGVALHELRAERASLEEVFMRLTADAIDYRATAPEPTPEHQS